MRGRLIPKVDLMNTNENLPKLPRPQIWDLWATIGFGVIIAIVFVVSQTVGAIVIGIIKINAGMMDPNSPTFASDIESNGILLAGAAITSAIVCIPLTFGAAALRKGEPVSAYLAFQKSKTRDLLFWLGASVVFIIASDLLTMLLGRPITPEFMDKTYQSAGGSSLFWIAIVVAAPLSEEIFFRGLLF